MTIDTDMERLYERVELVSCLGDRSRNQLCLMSFVALLAGETHGDNPSTASPLIRRYGIVLNDEMPSKMRQKLKPFAPRILNTRDEHDVERVQLLVEAWRNEIVPRVVADFGHRPNTSDQGTDELLTGRRALAEASAREQLAAASVHLLARYGGGKAGYRLREWYWSKAIDLLDRLCDVGGRLRVPFGAGQAMVALGMLGQSRKPQAGLMAAALMRIRGLSSGS